MPWSSEKSGGGGVGGGNKGSQLQAVLALGLFLGPTSLSPQKGHGGPAEGCVLRDGRGVRQESPPSQLLDSEESRSEMGVACGEGERFGILEPGLCPQRCTPKALAPSFQSY